MKMASSACGLLVVLLLCLLPLPSSSAKSGDEVKTSTVGRVADMEGKLDHAKGTPVRGLKGMTTETLNVVLGLAEAQYQANLQRRVKRIGEGGVESLGAGDFESVMLIPTYSCPVEVRMGQWAEGAGGGWVCLSLLGSGRRDRLALTFGTGCETTFERDIFETLDTRTQMFDFGLTARSVDELAALHFINYQNAGLTGSRKLEAKRRRFPSVRWVTLPSALRDAGAKYADLIKIDCEGCEFDVVKDLAKTSNRTHPAVGQILMEVHDVAEWKLSKVKALFSALEDLGFRLFHVEVNPFYKMHYQVALIHESLVKPQNLVL